MAGKQDQLAVGPFDHLQEDAHRDIPVDFAAAVKTMRSTASR
jgi:hypothetical protein